jgi:hypothetical protein
VDRTGERDAREMRAGWEADAPTRELRVSRQSAATPGESGAAAPLARDVAGQQMAVGDIPAQLPGFQPRPGLMAQLNRAGPEAPVVQVLTGRSGVGRTQLAAAYARAKLMAAWRLVAWVNAETPGRLLAGLAAVADATGLSDGGSGHGMADAGLVVRDWLETDGARCLLIFDDAEDPDVLRPFIPVRGAARVLITTARESVADLGTTIPVDVFSAE